MTLESFICMSFLCCKHAWSLEEPAIKDFCPSTDRSGIAKTGFYGKRVRVKLSTLVPLCFPFLEYLFNSQFMRTRAGWW